VIDEAQAIKNPNAKQTRIAKKLKAQAKFALTGTPVENRIGDLWSIFDFINPGLLDHRRSSQLREASGGSSAQSVCSIARAGAPIHSAATEKPTRL